MRCIAVTASFGALVSMAAVPAKADPANVCSSGDYTTTIEEWFATGAIACGDKSFSVVDFGSALAGTSGNATFSSSGLINTLEISMAASSFSELDFNVNTTSSLFSIQSILVETGEFGEIISSTLFGGTLGPNGSTVISYDPGINSIGINNDLQTLADLGIFTYTFTQVQNVSQVPGPLPVLGAAAAFGYSRKLRNRMARYREVAAASTID